MRLKIVKYLTLLACFCVVHSFSACAAETEDVFGETEEMIMTETEEVQQWPRKISVTVVSIVGNEMTYYESTADSEKATTESGEKGLKKEKTQGSGSEISDSKEGIKSEESDSKGEKSEEDSFGENDSDETDAKKSRSKKSGSAENTAGENGSAGKGSKERTSGSDGNASKKEGRSKGEAKGTKNRNTRTCYIPVGVPVHTDTNEVMTFSYLKAGDELEILLDKQGEEEVIVEVWMKTTEQDT